MIVSLSGGQTMHRVIQFVIALSLVLTASADFGDIRIYEGGDSGRLDFQLDNGKWGTVCKSGFDDDAGDVACDQLGYLRADDVYTYANFTLGTPSYLCDTDCAGYESALTYCYSLTYSESSCLCSGIVGLKCTNTLTTGQIVGIVIGSVAFVALIILCVVMLVCMQRRRRRAATITVTEYTPIATNTTTTYQSSAPPPYTAAPYPPPTNTGYPPATAYPPPTTGQY